MNISETTPDFWDCECAHEYIHSKSESECFKCGCLAEDMPDSIVSEVKAYFADIARKKYIKLVSTHYRGAATPNYSYLLDLLEEAVDMMAKLGPEHPREIIPGSTIGNKTLYGCLPTCSPPDWRTFQYFDYNACMLSDEDPGCVEPLHHADRHKAQFWTVYGRLTEDYGNELRAITDVTTEKMAEKLVKRFTNKLLLKVNGSVAGNAAKSTTELPRGSA